MCGRFALTTPAQLIAEVFGAGTLRAGFLPDSSLPPRYNIAPTQQALVVRACDGGRELASLRWGLIPSWADDPAIGSRMINARSETAATKPAYRKAFASRRCLVPADAFYEWKKLDAKTKQPMAIRVGGVGGLMAMAGLWQLWNPPEGDAVESFTILTTSANEALQEIHVRMPVILESEAQACWLDHGASVDDLTELLRPLPARLIEMHPVSSFVNSPSNDSQRCLEPVDIAKGPPGSLFGGLN